MTHMNFKGAILSNRIFNNFYLILAEIFSALLLFAIVYLKPFQYLLSTAALNPIGWAVPVLSALLLAILGQIFFMKKVDSSIAKE